MKVRKGVTKVLIGLLFLYFDPSLRMSDTFRIFLLPDFIAYILFFLAMNDFNTEEREKEFRLAKIFTVVCGVIAFAACIICTFSQAAEEAGLLVQKITGIVYQIALFTVLKDVAYDQDSEKDISFQMLSALVPVAYLASYLTPVIILPISAISSSIIGIIFGFVAWILKIAALLTVISFRRELKRNEEEKAAQVQLADTGN